jgi:hypothetical protein
MQLSCQPAACNVTLNLHAHRICFVSENGMKGSQAWGSSTLAAGISNHVLLWRRVRWLLFQMASVLVIMATLGQDFLFLRVRGGHPSSN